MLRQKPSIHAAYQATGKELPVSVTSVYNKFNGVEADTSRGLVDYSAEQAKAPTDTLAGTRTPLLPGVEVKKSARWQWPGRAQAPASGDTRSERCSATG